MAELKLNLVIKLLDQATAPVRRLGQTIAALDRPFRAARMAAGGLLRDLKALALAGGALSLALGVGLWRTVTGVADVGDAAQETSEKLGMSVLGFTRVAYAAKFSTIEAEALEDGLKFLNLSSSQAAAGAKQDAAAFEALGIAYKDAGGRLLPIETLLPQIADRFQAMEDGPRKGAIAMALFGRAGVKMIPLLNGGAAGLNRLGDEAERLGVAFGEEQARNGAAFNDSLDRLKASVFGLGNGIAGGLLPVLTSLIDRITAMIAANKPAVIERMKTLFAQLGNSLPVIIKGLGDFARFLGQIAAVLGPVMEMLGGFNGVLDVLAVIMVTRVAIAIWSAVSAVWGLNGAMLANPIGLVIAAVAALVLIVILMVKNWGQFAAFFTRMWARLPGPFRTGVGVIMGLLRALNPINLIIKHWATIVSFFQALWKRIGDAFKVGVAAVWNLLPPWFRQVLRGASFVIRAVSGVGSPPGPRPGPGPSPRGPGPAVGAAARAQISGEIGVRAIPDRDGRVPEVFARSNTAGFTLAPVGDVTTRGGR